MKITIERGGKRFQGTLDDVRNGDTVLRSNLTQPNPAAILPGVTDVTFIGCNLRNVLRDYDVAVETLDGGVIVYPAQPRTAGWVFDDCPAGVYGHADVREAKDRADRENAEFDRGIEFIEEFFDKMDKPAEVDPKKLEKAQALFDRLLAKDPEGVGRIAKGGGV